MLKIVEIKATIESLSEDEYARLREWFYERDWEKWNKRIEVDSESGKLDFFASIAPFQKSW